MRERDGVRVGDEHDFEALSEFDERRLAGEVGGLAVADRVEFVSSLVGVRAAR